MGHPATRPIVRPTFGEIHVTRQNTTERIRRIVVSVEQMLADDAILHLPDFPAPLTLDARGPLALLRVAATVEHADRVNNPNDRSFAVFDEP
jgi:hypothetical protein